MGKRIKYSYINIIVVISDVDLGIREFYGLGEGFSSIRFWGKDFFVLGEVDGDG